MFGSNLPTVERLIRLLLGVALAAFGWFGPAQPNLILTSLGICLALTGLAGFCPACAIFGRGQRRHD